MVSWFVRSREVSGLLGAMDHFGWLGEVIGYLGTRCCEDIEKGHGGSSLTPEDLFGVVSAQYDQFNMRLEATRTMLHSYPDLLADEIKKAVSQRPGIIEGK